LEGAVAEEFFTMVVNQARRKRLLSDDHFTVDGTLIKPGGTEELSRKKPGRHFEAAVTRDDGGIQRELRKEKRTNETHESLTIDFSRLFKKSQGAEASWAIWGISYRESEWAGGGCTVTQATGTAEREAAVI